MPGWGSSRAFPSAFLGEGVHDRASAASDNPDPDQRLFFLCGDRGFAGGGAEASEAFGGGQEGGEAPYQADGGAGPLPLHDSGRHHLVRLPLQRLRLGELRAPSGGSS